MTQDVEIVRGRGCSGCTLCCTLLGVAELDVAPLEPCPNCNAQRGCTIYADRPTECRQFFCAYLLDASMGEHWQPAKSRMVVAEEDFTHTLMIHTDPARPQAWRQDPYYSDICRWARAAARKGRKVVVWEGDRKIVIAPAEEARQGSV